jgi:hypothetical protein
MPDPRLSAYTRSDWAGDAPMPGNVARNKKIRIGDQVEAVVAGGAGTALWLSSRCRAHSLSHTRSRGLAVGRRKREDVRFRGFRAVLRSAGVASVSRRCLGKVLWVRKEGARCEVGNDNDPTTQRTSFPSAGRLKIEARRQPCTFAPLLRFQTQPLTVVATPSLSTTLQCQRELLTARRPSAVCFEEPLSNDTHCCPCPQTALDLCSRRMTAPRIAP